MQGRRVSDEKQSSERSEFTLGIFIDVIEVFQGIFSLHIVVVFFQERLHHIVEEFPIQVKEENCEQHSEGCEAYSKQLQAEFQEGFSQRTSTFFHSSFLRYHVMESSKSRREGSRGSSCMTVVM